MSHKLMSRIGPIRDLAPDREITDNCANRQPQTANQSALPQLFLQIGDSLLQLFQLALHGWEPF